MSLARFVALLSLTLAVVSVKEYPYKKIVHKLDPMAKCLDGSDPALYLHEGGDTTKFLIFFIGGGHCNGHSNIQVLEKCYQRSKTPLGSSIYLPEYMPSQGGYLSTDPDISEFAAWTKIIIPYCDGAFHQGSVQAPIQYKDTKLYFRGTYNTLSHLKWIAQNYKFRLAEKVVFTGASAGAVAAFMYSNQVRGMISNASNLYTIIDSGTFINHESYVTKEYILEEEAFWIWKVSSSQGLNTPFEACNQALPGAEFKCFLMQYAYPHIFGNVMIINSEYDEVALQTMQIGCLSKGQSGKTLKNCNQSQMSYIESYRSAYLGLVQKMIDKKFSIWTIACSAHSYACYGYRFDVEEQKVPAKVGLTTRLAIDMFVFNNVQVVMKDEVSWPNNQPCAY